MLSPRGYRGWHWPCWGSALLWSKTVLTVSSFVLFEIVVCILCHYMLFSFSFLSVSGASTFLPLISLSWGLLLLLLHVLVFCFSWKSILCSSHRTKSVNCLDAHPYLVIPFPSPSRSGPTFSCHDRSGPTKPFLRTNLLIHFIS